MTKVKSTKCQRNPSASKCDSRFCINVIAVKTFLPGEKREVRCEFDIRFKRNVKSGTYQGHLTATINNVTKHAVSLLCASLRQGMFEHICEMVPLVSRKRTSEKKSGRSESFSGERGIAVGSCLSTFAAQQKETGLLTCKLICSSCISLQLTFAG